MIKDVLVIFKTHLDVGFTDYAENIVKNYIEKFIPEAIKLGYELKDTDTPFVWTVGSWIMNEALKCDKDGKVDRAIRDGIITWHGLPFTTHTELMSEKLFDLGISISQKLDKKYGRRTIAAKMSDVPGHTIGMVPHLAKAGIELVHIGVNGATPVPDVPTLFRWKCGGESVIVLYNGGNYGDIFEFEDFVVAYGHTMDNKGPQDSEAVREIYKNLRDKYPNANVRAATLNDVAEKFRKMELPVIDKEIGDTWIHGAGTDPKKMAIFREVQRHIEGLDTSYIPLEENLLLVPEHTCGMDLKKHFKNDTDFFLENFEKTAEERKKIEMSWEEQRKYVYDAAALLGIDCEKNIIPQKPDLTGMKESAKDDIPVEISWQLFDNSDYERYFNTYMQTDVIWAIWDFTKVGLPDYKGGLYTAQVVSAWEDDCKKIYELKFDESIAKVHGLPSFFVETEGNNVYVSMFGKQANRLPQAIWLKFLNMKENWQINKMGQWINPDEIIDSNLITAIYSGVRNSDVEIVSYDAALVGPYGRHLLEYNIGKQKQDLYFNLYNNIWNTNFPMWYSDDIKFRFEIKNN